MIDVSAASSWVEPAQGLIRPTTQPPPPQTLLLHTAMGFSLTIQGLIDEPLFVFQPCTFLNLKSQFILGKCKRRRRRMRGRELKKNFRTSLFFFFFVTLCLHSSVIHRCSVHPSLTFINCVTLKAAGSWCSHAHKKISTISLEERYHRK